MLDIDVLTRAMKYPSRKGTQEEAAEACRAAGTPFTGIEVASQALGLPPTTTVQQLLTGCTPLLVATALARRGALLVNTAGRVAVVVAPGTVIQPAGRAYALTPTTTDAWVTGWWAPSVTLTLTVPS